MQPLFSIIKTIKRAFIIASKCALFAFFLWVAGVAVECCILDYNSTKANALTTASIMNVLGDRSQHIYKDEWYGDHIYCDGSISSQFVFTIENVETYLPDDTLAAFIADGWHITVTSAQDLTTLAKDLDSDTSGYSVVGLTDPNTKTIWLDASTSSIIGAMLHEFGHYVDYNLGWPSKTDAFAALYDSEHDAYSIYGSYAANNPTEMFANLYSDLLLTSTQGLHAAPKCAAYVADTTRISNDTAD